MSFIEQDAVTKRYRAHISAAMDRASASGRGSPCRVCLLGEPVRYDGGHSQSRFLANELDPFVEWVHVCPEMEAGLGTPRETLRLERGRGDPRMAYAEVFQRTFSRRASIRRNVNVLQQCLGMIGNALDAVRRADLAEAIAAYARRQVPLCVPTAMLLHQACGEEAQYVRGQTYFAPYPSELRLRDHVHDGQ
ncbi:DUF523 and DUF1722 domain-containing protein [Acrocarpospora sp. B8E8]|uniref:DUF523 and DUF1722 domain-containing protein n=1 Tax=Acrocarpospora sp. B8E8 TaxID=3153572 RepID=UPI00325EFDC8